MNKDILYSCSLYIKPISPKKKQRKFRKRKNRRRPANSNKNWATTTQTVKSDSLGPKNRNQKHQAAKAKK